MAVGPFLSHEGYLYPGFIVSVIKKETKWYTVFFLSLSLSSSHFSSGFRGVERENAPLVGQHVSFSGCEDQTLRECHDQPEVRPSQNESEELDFYRHGRGFPADGRRLCEQGF